MSGRAAGLGAAGLLMLAGAARGQCVQQWAGDIGIPAGIPGQIYAMTTWDPDGPGPLAEQLVVAGSFGTAGGVPCNKLARWDGVAWRPFGNGLGTNTAVAVYALTKWDPDGAGPILPHLIAAGHFAASAGGAAGNFIMRWDNAAGVWQPLGTGMNNDVHALTVWDPDESGPFPPQLVAGGEFTTADGVVVNRVARWDGSNWQPLGSGVNNIVTSLSTLDPDSAGPLPPVLVAGGSFTLAGGNAAARIARFDGTTWSAMGTGMNGTVWVLDHWDSGSGDRLIAGGDFTLANGVAASRVASFDGATWQPFATGMNGSVRCFTTWDPDGPGATAPRLVASGLFTTAGGAAIARIAHWDGAAWQGLGAGVNGSHVSGVTTWDPDGPGPNDPQLFAGGDFTLAAGNIANAVAAWISSPTPVITTSPSGATGCPGGQAVFTVRAAAGAFPTYHWRHAGVNLADGPTATGSTVAGSGSITLTISNISPADAGEYDVVVTNACGSGTSARRRSRSATPTATARRQRRA
jgi:hypothetical protein